MKKIIGWVVVFAALILGSYYGMGVVTERTLKKNIALMDQSNGWTLQVVEYHRGLYQSHALLRGMFSIPARTVKDAAGQETTQPAVDVTLKIPLDIYHGPVMWVDSKAWFGLGYARSDMTIPEAYADRFKQNFTADSTEPHLRTTVFINYFNQTHFVSTVPKFKLVALADKKELDWLGMSSWVDIASHASRVQGEVVLDGLHLKEDQNSATIRNVRLDYDFNQTPLNFYVGNATVRFPSMVVMNGDATALDIQTVMLHSSSQLKDNLFGSEFKVDIKQIDNEGELIGPIALDLSIDNLDASTLAGINDQMNQMQQGNESERHQALLSLLPSLPKLLSHGAKLSLDQLSITTPDGVVKANVQLSLPKTPSDNPFRLIQSIQGEGKLTVSSVVLKKYLTRMARQQLSRQALPSTATTDASIVAVDGNVSVAPTAAQLEQKANAATDERITRLVSSGVLVLEGSDYVAVLKLSQGELSVNGKPFNASMMQF